MAKRADTSGLDLDRVIGYAKPGNRAQGSVPGNLAQGSVPEKGEPSAGDSAPEAGEPQREPSKRKRPQATGYRETFLRRNEMKTRQCVYIGYHTHATIAKLVRALVSAGNEISVGGYIDTVLIEHLQAHKEEINEAYRRPQDDLIP